MSKPVKKKRVIWPWVVGGILVIGGCNALLSPESSKSSTANTNPTQTPSNPPKTITRTPLDIAKAGLIDDCKQEIASKFSTTVNQPEAITTVKPVSVTGSIVKAQVKGGGVIFNCRLDSAKGDQEIASIADPAVAKQIAQKEAAAAKATEAEQARAARAEQCGQVQLVLESWTWSMDDNFVKASGEVTNVSDRPLENAEVQVTYRTADGTMVKSGDALVDYNPILAGQTSPFETIDTMNPEMNTASISFKELMGGTYNFMERKEYNASCT